MQAIIKPNCIYLLEIRNQESANYFITQLEYLFDHPVEKFGAD